MSRESKAAWMRAHRKRWHELTPEQQRKAHVRAYGRLLVRRGVLVPQPCEVCGKTCNIERHHPDYSQPRLVRWLCRRHHRELTQQG